MISKRMIAAGLFWFGVLSIIGMGATTEASITSDPAGFVFIVLLMLPYLGLVAYEGYRQTSNQAEIQH